MKKLLFLTLLFLLSSCSQKYEKRLGKELEKEGDVFFSQRKTDEAIKKWKESLNFRKSSRVYEKIVTTLIIEKKNKEAKKWAEEGLTYFPECVNLIYNFAYLNAIEGKYEVALKAVNKLLGINGYYPEAHFLKGIIFEKTGREKEAKREYIKEININPGCKKAWKKIKEMKNEDK